MTQSLLMKMFGSHFITVLSDERGPLCVGDFAIVDSADIEKWKARFAAEGVAKEDVGEDRGSIDQADASSVFGSGLRAR